MEIVGKSLWHERTKTLQDALLLGNNQLQGGNSKSTPSKCFISHLMHMNYYNKYILFDSDASCAKCKAMPMLTQQAWQAGLKPKVGGQT